MAAVTAGLMTAEIDTRIAFAGVLSHIKNILEDSASRTIQVCVEIPHITFINLFIAECFLHSWAVGKADRTGAISLCRDIKMGKVSLHVPKR